MTVVKIVLIVIGSIVGVVLLMLAFVLVDFTAIFVPLTPIIKTNESKLVLRDGVMYTKKGKPFTGTSVHKGLLETYPQVETGYYTETGERITTQDGKRITDYKDGLKDGREQYYYTYRNSMFGMLGGPDVYTTTLHSETHYKNGLKDGVEIFNYTSSKYREIEAQYTSGLLNGLYKEYHNIEGYRKNEFSNNIGPLKLEAEYKNGQLSGFYRTYSQYGDTSENYVCIDSKVIEGRISTRLDTTVKWEWYKNGELIEERIFDHSSYGNSCEPPSADNLCGGVMLSETYFSNGQITEQRIFNPNNQKVSIYKKRVAGQLVEIFNRDTGVDRRAEFGE